MIKWSKKIKLPADLFSRNTLFSLLIQKLLEKKSALGGNGSEKKPQQTLFEERTTSQTPDLHSAKILDVGGFGGKLAWFLPEKINLTILDQKPVPEGKHTNYIQGDARTLPFPDESFDLVLSSDTLEHLTPQDRLPVIKELIRVSKRYVILAAPFNNIITQKAEEYINEQYKQITGKDHPFLNEHLQNGLPDLEEVENFLSENNYSYVKLGEGNINNWFLFQLVQGIQTNGDSEPEKVEQAEHNLSFNEFFNEHLTELGNFRSPTYRTIFCIDKEKVLLKQEFIELIEEKNNLHTTVYFEAVKKAFDQFQKVINHQKTAIKNLELNHHQKLKEIEKLTHNHDQNLKVIIANKEQELKLSNAKINELNQMIEEQEQNFKTRKLLIEEQQVQIHHYSEKVSSLEKRLELLEKQVTTQENFLTKVTSELENKQKELESYKNIIIQKEHNIQQKTDEIRQKTSENHSLQHQLAEHQKSLQEIFNSRSWKLIMVYSKLKQRFYLAPKKLFKKGWDILTKLGPKIFMQRLLRKFLKQDQKILQNEYQAYVEKTKLTPADIKRIQKEVADFKYKPMISIIMPVYNVEEKWLRKAIDSVLNQLYPKWELCMADDASPLPHIKEVLEEYRKKDSRIKVFYRPKNGGIVKASNSALKLAQGAYIALMDNDDEITPDAFYEVVKVLQEKKYDLLYSDEDKLEMDGTRTEPYFKSDFNQDLLMCCNFISHLGIYRRKMIEEIGGFREGLDGAQDFDLVLRCTEKERSIHHIRKILYHWRKIPGSTAASTDAKPYVFESAKKALRDTLKKRNIKAEVTDGLWKFSFRVRREIEGEPLVSIIIPFKDKMDILKICLDSIFEKTTYKNYEIILIDNASELLETIEYMKEVENCPRVRLFHYNAPFNYSAINNFAVQQAKGDYLLLLNNDTEVIEPQWIENMLEHAQRPEVGAVGAKLLYPNNLIQHAGVVVGLGGVANHAFSKRGFDDPGYFGLINATRNLSAVTAACMMTRRDVYEKMHGLDEENLAVAFNDVDFCLRLREAGYLIVYTPYALLYHHESLSRGYTVAFNEEYYMHRRHQGIMRKGDPYYNPNLTMERLDYSLRVLDKVQE